LHYPVLDKRGEVINTAVTNLDLHDLARLARTYGLRAYYVIQPLELQRRLVQRLSSYWMQGKGGEYNLTRKQAFESMRVTASFDEAVEGIEKEAGQRPRVVATTAKKLKGSIGFSAAKEMMKSGGAWLLLFGTGWGVDPEFIERSADYVLDPIDIGSGYNHLSVRTAAAIILDRLECGRDG